MSTIPYEDYVIYDPFPEEGDDLTPFFRSYSDDLEAPSANVDWKETSDAHVFKVDLPGLGTEEVKVQVQVEDGNVLRICGEVVRERKESTEDVWHMVERSVGIFVRRFRLPRNARTEEINAVMDCGVLTVTIPKETVRKSSVKNVKISCRGET